MAFRSDSSRKRDQPLLHTTLLPNTAWGFLQSTGRWRFAVLQSQRHARQRARHLPQPRGHLRVARLPGDPGRSRVAFQLEQAVGPVVRPGLGVWRGGSVERGQRTGGEMGDPWA